MKVARPRCKVNNAAIVKGIPPVARTLPLPLDSSSLYAIGTSNCGKSLVEMIQGLTIPECMA